MRILVVTKSLNVFSIREAEAVPRVGELVDGFYEPLPAVTEVIWWPSMSRLQKMGVLEGDAPSVIVVVE